MKKLSEDLTNNNNYINEYYNKNKCSKDYFKNIETFKIVFIGNSCSGKTSIIEKYINNIIIKNHYTTICIDFKSKIYDINNLLNKNLSHDEKIFVNNYLKENELIKLQIWDTSGCPKYRNLIKYYIKNTDLFILVIDITDNNFSNNIMSYFEDIDELYDEPEFLIVFNKIDNNQNIINIISLYKLDKYDHVEISCFDNNNINNLFDKISLLLIKKYMTNIEKNKINDDFLNKKKLRNSICGVCCSNSKCYYV